MAGIEGRTATTGATDTVAQSTQAKHDASASGKAKKRVHFADALGKVESAPAQKTVPTTGLMTAAVKNNTAYLKANAMLNALLDSNDDALITSAFEKLFDDGSHYVKTSMRSSKSDAPDVKASLVAAERKVYSQFNALKLPLSNDPSGKKPPQTAAQQISSKQVAILEAKGLKPVTIAGDGKCGPRCIAWMVVDTLALEKAKAQAAGVQIKTLDELITHVSKTDAGQQFVAKNNLSGMSRGAKSGLESALSQGGPSYGLNSNHGNFALDLEAHFFGEFSKEGRPTEWLDTQALDNLYQIFVKPLRNEGSNLPHTYTNISPEDSYAYDKVDEPTVYCFLNEEQNINLDSADLSDQQFVVRHQRSLTSEGAVDPGDNSSHFEIYARPR